MTKDEALDLALQALEIAAGNGPHDYPKYSEALTAIQQARSAPVQKRPQNCGTGYCSCVECVMEPAPVQEQIELAKQIWREDQQRIAELSAEIDRLTAAQPAPVQVSPLEFVTMVMEKEHLVGKPLFWAEWPNKENT